VSSLFLLYYLDVDLTLNRSAGVVRKDHAGGALLDVRRTYQHILRTRGQARATRPCTRHLKKLSAVVSITIALLALGFGRIPFDSMRARFYDLSLTLPSPIEVGVKSETFPSIASMYKATTTNTPNSTIARTLTSVADSCDLHFSPSIYKPLPNPALARNDTYDLDFSVFTIKPLPDSPITLTLTPITGNDTCDLEFSPFYKPLSSFGFMPLDRIIAVGNDTV
jgi:hypothetical protein